MQFKLNWMTENIGCLIYGVVLYMTTMDIIKLRKGDQANF